jgi:hypothetical protein
VGNRIQQTGVEIIGDISKNRRTPQVGIEVVHGGCNLRQQEGAIEVVFDRNPFAKFAQLGIEVIYPYVPPVVRSIQEFICPGG